MKGSEFINLMRKVIREEVRAVVKDELGYIKTLISETKAKQPEYKVPQQKRQAPPVKRSQPIVQLDGVLGELLNETAQSMLNESTGYSDQMEDWPSLGDMMTTDDIPAMTHMAPSSPMQNNRFDPDPTAAFIKDYSAVMKAADAHQGKI
jgi:hypothetical protein